MKKYLAIILFGILAVSTIFGCTKKDESSVDPSETESADPSSESEGLTTADYSYLLNEDGYIQDVEARSFVTLPDWKTVEFKKSEVVPDDDTVNEEIAKFAAKYPVSVKDRAVAEGDLVNMDYSGKLDGVAFQGGTATNQKLTAGSNEFVDNFLTKIIGHMPGETFDLEITFPDPYQSNTELSGKLTIFTVTIHEILETPEVTDEWLQEHLTEARSYFLMEDLTTVDEIRDMLRDYIKGQNLYRMVRERVAEMEYESMPDNVYDCTYKATDNHVFETYGVHLSVFAAYVGYSDDDIKDLVMSDSVVQLYYQAVAETEGFKATEKDIQELIGDDVLEDALKKYGKGYLSHIVILNQVQEYIEERVSIVD